MKIFLTILLISSSLYAGIDITSMQVLSKGSEIEGIKISYKGVLLGVPDLQLDKDQIQLTLHDVNQVDAKNSALDLIKTQQGRNTYSVAINTNYNARREAENIHASFKDNEILLSFPKVANTKEQAPLENAKVPAKVEKSVVRKEVPVKEEKKQEKTDQEYLDYLLESASSHRSLAEGEQVEKADEVSLQAASTVTETAQPQEAVAKKEAANFNPLEDKNKKSNFSNYMLKIFFLLTGVVLVFAVIIQVFRKLLAGRGKLSFLKNNKMIEVISTNHIAPKKSLILVKVHEQILLLSNSDAGLSFMTEIEDPTGLLKHGEKLITGANFDDNLATEKKQEKANVKLKDMSKLNESRSNKISEQIRNKVKSLKQLQQ